MDCIFCKISRGELPSKKIFESDRVVAFEDINKVAPVHVLVIPKAHYESVMDLPASESELIIELHRAIQEVAHITGLGESGFRLLSNRGSSAGQTVFHLHYHIIGGRDLDVKLG